ncbi:hypothetical protein CPC08DRAFT_729911 [Agrocybe pediades]|nr:hypothetical protein CPC08DRAFT_729911 [Agrocybe pediades]
MTYSPANLQLLYNCFKRKLHFHVAEASLSHPFDYSCRGQAQWTGYLDFSFSRTIHLPQSLTLARTLQFRKRREERAKDGHDNGGKRQKIYAFERSSKGLYILATLTLKVANCNGKPHACELKDWKSGAGNMAERLDLHEEVKIAIDKILKTQGKEFVGFQILRAATTPANTPITTPSTPRPWTIAAAPFEPPPEPSSVAVLLGAVIVLARLATLERTELAEEAMPPIEELCEEKEDWAEERADEAAEAEEAEASEERADALCLGDRPAEEEEEEEEVEKGAAGAGAGGVSDCGCVLSPDAEEEEGEGECDSC